MPLACTVGWVRETKAFGLPAPSRPRPPGGANWSPRATVARTERTPVGSWRWGEEPGGRGSGGRSPSTHDVGAGFGPATLGRASSREVARGPSPLRGHGLDAAARRCWCRSRARLGGFGRRGCWAFRPPLRTRAPGPVGGGPFDPFGAGRVPCEARARLRQSPRPHRFRAAGPRPGGARRASSGGGLPRRDCIRRVRARPSRGALPDLGDAARGPCSLGATASALGHPERPVASERRRAQTGRLSPAHGVG